MNNNFNTALKDAMEVEFSYLDTLENPYKSYRFSSDFESKMNVTILKSEFTYVSIGKKRIRKALLVALIALLAFAITGCAFAVHYIIEWHEEQNHKNRTLDITFETRQEYSSNSSDATIPKTPSGYTITEQSSDEHSLLISYSHPQGDQISFSQLDDVENMGISIDNDATYFEAATINGYKGYAYSKDGINTLYWADSTYFYVLQGTCEMDILETMAETTFN